MAALHARITTTTTALQREIAGEMRALPLDRLLALREFAIFLRERSLPEQAASAVLLGHATVERPADTLLGLMDLLPPIGGDALADTEALYDQWNKPTVS